MSASSSAAPPRTASLEVRSIDWIPENERHAKLWHQGPLWFLGNFQYFSIPIGFIGPSLGLSLGWTVLAALLGIAIGTVFMAFHASQGPIMGLPQMLQSRAQFGYRGVIVPLIAVFFTYMAFTVVDTVLLGQGLQSAFGFNPVVVAVLASLLAALLAIAGHDWLHRVFRVLLYVSVPLVVIVSIGILAGHATGGHAPAAHHGGFTVVAFLAELTACAAYNITYAPYVSDYSRYLPVDTSPRKVIATVFVGASASAIWLIAIGAWLATRLGATDGLAGLLQAGNNVFPHLGDVTAFVSALALLATLGMSAYGAMLTALTGIDSFKPLKPAQRHRVITLLVLMVAWFAISQVISSSAVNTVFIGLTLMLYLLVPWTATNLVDFFFVRRGHYSIRALFTVHGIYGTWNWRGLTAYAAGFAAEIPFMILGSYVGPGAQALGGVDLAWVVGLIVSTIVYIAVTRSLDVTKEPTDTAQTDSAKPEHSQPTATQTVGASFIDSSSIDPETVPS